MPIKKPKDDEEAVKAPKKRVARASKKLEPAPEVEAVVKKPKSKAKKAAPVSLQEVAETPPKGTRKAKLTPKPKKQPDAIEENVLKSEEKTEQEEQTLLPHQEEEILLQPEPTLRLTQIKSPISRPKYQRQTLIGLGLNKLNRVALVHETPSIMGMINAVKHLIKVEVIDRKSYEIEHDKR